VTCSDAADELLKYCAEAGIDLIGEHGLGHGIGVSPVEPPFLDPADSTELREGMVLVLTPTVKGPEGELVRSYDTVIIGKNGPRLVGWYKDWNTPYKAVKSYQHGGG
jgi:Xaa-Pro aminopeptidase